MAGFHISFLSDFPDEEALIGKLILAYSELEVDLSALVEAALSDEVALKALFRTRGEGQRIEIGDGMVRSFYEAVGLGTEFSEAIGAMKYAVKIRNQYAHCNWYSEAGKLGFINLEDAAKCNGPVSSNPMALRSVDVVLLREQERYYCFVQECLEYLEAEYQLRAKKSSNPSFPKPQKVDRPPLDNRKRKHHWNPT